MSNELEVLYFGCIRKTGHYQWSRKKGQQPTKIYKLDSHVNNREIDADLCAGGEHKNAQGAALLHHSENWSVIAFWDRSVDKRGNSNSAFFVNRPKLDFDDMVLLSAEYWPEVWGRFDFEVFQVFEP